jgi:hypothetical protein
LTAQAELDGLGPADGPIVTWTVPEDFAQAEPQGALPFDLSSGTGTLATASWLGLLCLLLVVVLLLIRTSSKGPPPATPRAR